MIVKKYNVLPKKYSHKLPDLWCRAYISNDTHQVLGFFTDEDDFIGAAYIRMEGYTFVDGIPYFDIFLHTLEVVPVYRHHGYGTDIYNWIIINYRVHRCSLCHRDTDNDGGVSYRFWRSKGLRKPSVIFNKMEKVYIK